MWKSPFRLNFWPKSRSLPQSLSRVRLFATMDYSLLGSSVHWIFQAIVLEWIAISFSRGSSQPRDRTWVSHIVDRRLTVWATREVMEDLLLLFKIVNFWLCWVFVAAFELSIVAESVGHSLVVVRELLMAALPLSWSTGSGACGLLILVACGLSGYSSWVLEHRLSACGTQT